MKVKTRTFEDYLTSNIQQHNYMKQHTKKQFAGIWLDNHKAIIITHIPEGETDSYSIKENLKAPEHHGGGNEHTMNNAKQSDTLKYFKSVSGHLLNYDEILVFGPGKSQEQFLHHLRDNSQFKDKQITLESAEALTDPQMIAKVRDFFKSRAV